MGEQLKIKPDEAMRAIGVALRALTDHIVDRYPEAAELFASGERCRLSMELQVERGEDGKPNVDLSGVMVDRAEGFRVSGEGERIH